MSEFKKYPHLERIGTDEVEGILDGNVFIFPKIDGTNASLWWDEDGLCAGSRNRKLTLDNDNAGFYNFAIKDERYKKFFEDFPNLRLYGEWLVPHSLKTYRDDVWRKFYVFDVMDENDSFLDYYTYKELMDRYSLEYIPCLLEAKNIPIDRIYQLLERNDFLIKDGLGHGEGLVIKQYEYVNKFKRTTWAKLVTSEFKEKHIKELGSNKIEYSEPIEKKIADEFVTMALVEKTISKIILDTDGWTSRNIPRLLNTVFYELVKEESWNFIKKYKYPIINFGTLNRYTILKVKELREDLF